MTVLFFLLLYITYSAVPQYLTLVLYGTVRCCAVLVHKAKPPISCLEPSSSCTFSVLKMFAIEIGYVVVLSLGNVVH